MNDHPTAAEIAGMARGTISRNGLQRMVAHLLEGCQRCARQLASAIELTTPAQAAASTGAACSGAGPARRSSSQRRSLAQSAAPQAYDQAAYDPPIARACATALRHLRQLEHDRRQVRAGEPDAAPPASSLAATARTPAAKATTAPLALAATPAPTAPMATPALTGLTAIPALTDLAATLATTPATRAATAKATATPAGQADAAPLAALASPGEIAPQARPPVAAAAARSRRKDGSKEGERRHPVALLKVEMLLTTAWDLRHTDPQKMLQIAELALSAAERLDGSRHGEAAVADLRARAAAELGNAYRVCDDFLQAERMMAEAVRWQRRGSGDLTLVVRIGDLLASLLVDQRRFPEADELLDQVQSYYQKENDPHLAGRTLIKRGIFAGYDGAPRRALRYLTEGLELIDVQQDRRLAVQAVHSILWNLVECERYRQARIHLWRTRALLLEHGGEIYPLLLRWLEGRIDAGLGELDRAERELAATRQGFADAGYIFNAALSSLDLAAVWLRQGKTMAVRQLVEEMIATFRALRLAREAVAALLILREACDRDEATLDRVQAVAALLTELEHQQPRRHSETPVAD